MLKDKLKIGFVRRGFSASGGAEVYLKRLAQGVLKAGHAVQLFTTDRWPQDEWTFGPLTRLRATLPIAFADEMEQARQKSNCDVFMSLERIWDCDVYRAGDGVHRAWLEQRAKILTPLRKFASQLSRKHADILRLEESLFRKRRADRVIANSRMVKKQIIEFYDYPAEKIDLVYNGIPLDAFSISAEARLHQRQALGLKSDDIALLFVGSGWERKGLGVAIEAVKTCDNPKLRLFVAGRGEERKFHAPGVQFLGLVRNVAALYAATDIFILPTLYDPFSNACLEALASGLPVITTSTNGFSETIEEGVHGSVIHDAADVEAIARAIDAWSDPGRRAQARPLILERGARFDISKNVARTLEILVQEAAASAASASGKIRKT
jgi:UDP-glucose:(heptosyl)LPS alpha-1,3-glucosyltransferase